MRWVMMLRSVVQTRVTRRVAVMDRYAFCPYAAIRVRGQRGERLARLVYRFLPQPDLVVYLAVDPAVAQVRVERRGRDHETLGYLTAADAAYRSLPEFGRFVVLPADGSASEVRASLITLVSTPSLWPSGPKRRGV